MQVFQSPLKGCIVLTPTVFSDDRGCFFESYKKEVLNEALGQEVSFVQDNESFSSKGVLRGLHFQKGAFAQAKLVRVVHVAFSRRFLDVPKKHKTSSKN